MFLHSSFLESYRTKRVGVSSLCLHSLVSGLNFHASLSRHRSATVGFRTYSSRLSYKPHQKKDK